MNRTNSTRVLIIDDDPINIIGLKAIVSQLKIPDIIIHTAFNVDGITAVYEDAVSAGEPFSHVMIDMHMPDMNADEVLKHFNNFVV